MTHTAPAIASSAAPDLRAWLVGGLLRAGGCSVAFVVISIAAQILLWLLGGPADLAAKLGLLAGLSALVVFDVLAWLRIAREAAVTADVQWSAPVAPVIAERTARLPDVDGLPRLASLDVDPERRARLAAVHRHLLDASRSEAQAVADAERLRRSVDPQCEHDRSRHRRQARCEYSAIALTAVIAWVIGGLLLPLPLAAGAMLLAGGAAVLARLHDAPLLRVSIRPDRAQTPAAIAAAPYRTAGTVGGNLVGSTGFEEKFVAYGIAGELRTAEVLDQVLGSISRITVLHSVRYPGSERADLDHLILVDTAEGPVLLIVDSKAWKPSTWVQVDATAIRSAEGETRTSSMLDALEHLRAEGFGAAQARTVIHATSGASEVRGLDGVSHRYVTSIDLAEEVLALRSTAPETRPASWQQGFDRTLDSLRARLV